MKKCFKCGETKELNMFYEHKQMADGYLNKCMECTKKDVKGSNYDKTEKGVVRVIYKTQVRNSKARNMDLPSYTKEQLKVWLYSNNFEKLYNDWVNSGFEKAIKPSVDRLDDFKPYSFDNIRLVTWKENRKKQSMDRTNGTGTSGRSCKPVVQYDSNGNILAEYHSFSFAKRVIGYDFWNCLKKGTPSRIDGTYWKYKE